MRGSRELLSASGLWFVLTVSPVVPLITVTEYGTSLPSGQSPGPFLIDLKQEHKDIMGWAEKKNKGIQFRPILDEKSPHGTPFQGKLQQESQLALPVQTRPVFSQIGVWGLLSSHPGKK